MSRISPLPRRQRTGATATMTSAGPCRPLTTHYSGGLGLGFCLFEDPVRKGARSSVCSDPFGTNQSRRWRSRRRTRLTRRPRGQSSPHSGGQTQGYPFAGDRAESAMWLFSEVAPPACGLAPSPPRPSANSRRHASAGPGATSGTSSCITAFSGSYPRRVPPHRAARPVLQTETPLPAR